MPSFSKFIFMIVVVGFTASAHAGWQQTFADEFNGPSLDTSIWGGTNYWGQRSRLDTGEQECYVDNLATVGSGALSLTAIDTPPSDCVPNAGNLLYQSGQVTTAGSFRQAYGYFEIRAKMPQGKGLWPQFRLDQFGGSFPPRPPEIIGVQTYGSASQAIQEYDDLDLNSQVVRHFNVMTAGADLSADFHTYGVDWQPGLIIWYFDGAEVYRYADAGVWSQPMYMILNLAVGGNQAGAPDATTVFPAVMQVDYVHVFERVNDGNPDTLPPGVTPPPPPQDTVAPKVAILSPFNGTTVKRKSTIVLAAVAVDNVKVTNITFNINGKNMCSVNGPLDVCLWTVPNDSNSYTITATAKDAAGNHSSTSVTVKAK